MRLPRVRLTVRRMVVAVAVVAASASIPAGEFLRRRSRDYATRADNYAVELTLGGAVEPPPITDEEMISEQRKEERLRYYSAMEHKYRHAARRPWLPVEPDPPPP